MSFTLSKYFPKGTEYFYSFPAVGDTSFFNRVPPFKEELVAARPLVCAGKNVKVITFYSTTEFIVWRLLNELNIKISPPENIIVFPKNITSELNGKKRNKLIKEALSSFSSKGKLIMAQPLVSDKIANKYLIPPEVAIWCNDKKNITHYIDTKYLPKRYKIFSNGKLFFEDGLVFPFPCVVKVSSSSSGDGVRICRSQADLNKARKKFR